MPTQTIDFKKEVPNDEFQHIYGESLSLLVISHQILTSSRIEASTYECVVFSDCNFYGCEFEGITFIGCIFEHCTFEFSHFRHCIFQNCHFGQCQWTGASSRDSRYEECDLGPGLVELCQYGNNSRTSGRKVGPIETYLELAVAA